MFCCRVYDAEDLVRLYHIVHPGCDSVKSVKSETDSLGLVKVCVHWCLVMSIITINQDIKSTCKYVNGNHEGW